MTAASGLVIAVQRGGCIAYADGETRELRLLGRHALREVELAVGDEVSWDPERGIVLEVAPRRTVLARRRPRDDRRSEQVIAANMDRLAVIASVERPPFRPGLVDRFLVAGLAGGLEVILVVNKIDLLEDRELPEEARAYGGFLGLFPVSAKTGAGVDALAAALAGSRTVLAGHSGVGKSSLLNALRPELRLETAPLRRGETKGRHTTRRATLYRLAGDAIVVDTPGVREIAAARPEAELVDAAFPDVVALAEGCRFRDCRHDREPDCAVRAAVERGDLLAARLASYRRLRAEARGRPVRPGRG
jgi:ribosome biogenesis GTPase